MNENVTSDHTIIASFLPVTYTITPTAGTGGTITPSSAVLVDHGGSRTFTITPDTGHHIVDVLVDGVSIGAATSHTFTDVTANHTISASFAINTYTVTASAGPNGTISPNTPQTVSFNGTATFTMLPDTGYLIASVTGRAGTLNVDSYTTGPITAGCTVNANFAPQ